MFGGVYGATAFTCSAAVPLAVPDVAVITASPAPAPVARPLAEIVATEAGDALHVTGAPGIGLFDASNTVAVYCCVPPWLIVALAGATVTLAAVGVTTVPLSSL